MCLLTRQIKPKTTTKDMIVLKRLRVNDNYGNTIKTRYYNYYYSNISEWFEYIPGVLNITTLNISRNKPKKVSAFASIDAKFYKENLLKNRNVTVIDQDFHFILENAESLRDFSKYEKEHYLFKFLIPKGSQIFLGATGLGVTNQIIMLDPNSK